MRKRVPSHFNSGVVTLNTKCDQPTHNHDFSGNWCKNRRDLLQTPIRKHYFEQHYPSVWIEHVELIISAWENWIGGWSMCVMHWHEPHYFVVDRLVGVLIQLPVVRHLDGFWAQNRSRRLQIKFQTSLRTYSSPRTAWTHKIRNFRHHLA